MQETRPRRGRSRGKRDKPLAPIVVAAHLVVGCAGDPGVQPESGQRESILDRVVHIESELLTEIPTVDRWCDVIHGLTPDRIVIGDAALYVEEEGEGVPIVLLHGGPGGTHHYFHPWFSRAAEFARVIYYDQRGCGRSDWEPGTDGYSVRQAASDLDALRAALGIEKWVVLGYSYGGFLGQLYTLRYPERVAGLVLSSASPGLWADLGSSRQMEYVSDEERDRMTEAQSELDAYRSDHGLSDQEYSRLRVYNNLVNGDWKRQNFYRPSIDDVAKAVRYEADFDAGFNGVVRATASAIDLTGAFEVSPIPTLILEGEYDLNWGDRKRSALAANHPSARSERFEMVGHHIYNERPEPYFSVLEEFVSGLREVRAEEITFFREHVKTWDERRRNSPLYVVRAASRGRSGSAVIASAYSRAWLEDFDDLEDLMKLGFALYDAEMYDEAFAAFERMETKTGEGSRTGRPLALVWQGHVLDLLGRREEAIARYETVVGLGLTGRWSHEQYGLEYEFDPYARQRARIPFDRLENQEP